MDKKLKIGFTGSRDGISEKAHQKLKHYLNISKNDITEGHHGDCIGGDTIFHNELKKYDVKIIIHPPLVNTLRSFCKGDDILKPKSYLDRNKEIVDNVDILLAFPKTKEEVLRSGTWATIRYARKQKKRILIFNPCGEIITEYY